MTQHREIDIIQAFADLTDRLVADYDVVDLTSQLAEDCAKLLNVEAVGLLLADAGGVLHLLAATSAQARKLELFQLQRDEGPCLDCFHTGKPINVADLRTETERWPTFAMSAQQQGFRSVHAIPMRLGDQHLGAMGLFGKQPGDLRPEDLELARGLAHVASIAIVRDTLHDPDRTLPALQTAVASRGIVEIAQGVLNEKHNLDMDQAFNRLRSYAHHHQLRLTDIARQVVSGQLPSELLATDS